MMVIIGILMVISKISSAIHRDRFARLGDHINPRSPKPVANLCAVKLVDISANLEPLALQIACIPEKAGRLNHGGARPYLLQREDKFYRILAVLFDKSRHNRV